MKKYPFLSLKTNNLPYIGEIKDAVSKVVESGWFLNGENVKCFESEIAALCRTRYAVACSNGLDALRLIFRAYIDLGLMGEGDEVIVPANTYIASVLAVTDNRLRPVFVEPSEVTLNLDIEKVEKAITKRTKAIMVVHLYGAACWSPEINRLASEYGLKIVEDNAQAIGAVSRFDGLAGTCVTGGLGDAAGLSFYPTKNLGALGDAGAVTTNDAGLAGAVRALANYGSDRRYHNIYKGLNCRMDEIQAAVLRVKLQHLQEITAARRERAAVYDSCITNPLVKKPFFDEGAVWHQYVVRVSGRDRFRQYLLDNGVETDVHYAVPPHLQPCYREYAGLGLPVTERIAGEVTSLPVTEGTTVDDVREISLIINAFR